MLVQRGFCGPLVLARLQLPILALTMLIIAGWLSPAATQAQVESFSRSGVSEIPTVECEALVALFNATGGPSWTRMGRTKWLETDSPCSWDSVDCREGHIVNLVLNNSNLRGDIPPKLGDLSYLHTLALNHNELTGSIPPELGNLLKLRFLFLGRNQLTGSIPGELGNIPRLFQLSLANNQLSGSIPKELGNLSSLNSLTLFDNQLSGRIPGELGDMSGLKILHLSDNELSGPLPRGMKNLNLRVFSFADTALCEPDDPAFREWLSGIDNLKNSGRMP